MINCKIRPRHKFAVCAESGKQRYRSRRDGLEILTRTRHIAAKYEMNGLPCRRKECRVYKCDTCGGWHLTSTEAWA